MIGGWVAALLLALEMALGTVVTTPDHLDWTACAGSAPGVECAVLQVPLDHEDPEAGLIGLPVRRLGALDKAERIGVLVSIAGGPGQRGTDLVHRGAHTDAIEARFDIVSWDPRGTSHESLIDCIPVWDPFPDLDRTPDTAAERRALDERISSLADRCREAHADVLPHVGTLATVRDLELLKRALGESRITILGSSYGSQVALTYATLFPDRVRAIVVDGYSDPNSSPAEREIEQAAAFERELDGLLARCASDAACPLHNDGQPGLALDRLLERLDEEPMSAGEGKRLGGSDAYEAILGSLLAEPARRALLAALADAADGRGEPLWRIAHEVRQAYEASGLTQGVFMAVYCADTGPWWKALSAAEIAQIGGRFEEIAPRLGAWLWSPPAADDLPPVGLCAMQSLVKPGSEGPIDAAGAGPVLVLAATGDPSTPFEAARRSVDDLEQAVLLPVEADRHLAYHHAVASREVPVNGCVVDAVEAYLIDLELPRNGSACTRDGRG